MSAARRFSTQTSKYIFQAPSQPPLLTGLGSKYARTLFNQAKEAKAELQVREDLSKFSLYVKNDRAIMTELMNPIKTEAEKIAHVNKSLTAAAGKPHAVTVAFLAEMQSKKRLDLLHKIKDDYSSIMDFDAKTLAGVVISAEPLSKDQFEKVKAKIQSVTDPSAKLLLSQKVDTSILGGLVVEVGGLRKDLSVANQINVVEQYLKA